MFPNFAGTGMGMGMGMPGAGLPIRGGRKDMLRAQRLYTSLLNGPPSNPNWASGSNATSWSPGMYNPVYNAMPQPPSPASNGSPLHDIPPYYNYPASSPGHEKPRMKKPKQRPAHGRDHDSMPFDKAAAALYDATLTLQKHCSNIYHDFDKETRNLSYAPSQLIDELWKYKFSASDPDNNPGSTRIPRVSRMSSTLLSDSAAQNFEHALQNLLASQPPTFDRLDEAGASMSPEVFKISEEKLGAAVQRLAQLMAGVKNKRDLMPPLVRELMDLHVLLEDMMEGWRPGRRAG